MTKHHAPIRRTSRQTGRMRTAPKGVGAPLRSLTHSLDLGKEKAMANPTRTCTVEGCEKRRKYRLYCDMHQARVRKSGTVEAPRHLDPGCSIEGCGRPHNALGYCKLHYTRVRLHGSPEADRPPKFVTAIESDDVEARILERTERDGDCVVWVGYRMRSGYGTIRWRGRDWVVHRAMYTVAVGPIPEGDQWTIDHLCRNRACVNVAHLELVTRVENSRRGGGLEKATERNRSATSCPNGHEYTPENTGRRGSGRACLKCRSARWEKQKDAVNARRRAEYGETKHAKEETSE